MTSPAAGRPGPSTPLTTFAPEVEDTAPLYPTGNLLVSLPELDEFGRCHSLGVVSEAHRGLLEARGSAQRPLLEPLVVIDGVPLVFTEPASGGGASSRLGWTRDHAWIPEAALLSPSAEVRLRYLAPIGEQGVVARIDYRNTGSTVQRIELAWSGQWESTQLRHFRARRLELPLTAFDDEWTGCRTVYAGGESLVLALSWRAGAGAVLGPGPERESGAGSGLGPESPSRQNSWLARREAAVEPGESLALEIYLGVSTESDGAAGTALHLRRRGFDALLEQSRRWLAERMLHTGSGALDARLNLNLFFNYFYAQADCVDTGRPVMLTSRSPRYYVCGAFWSRDAYAWSFPALLLTDARRARRVLLASLESAGADVAHHALYITGTRLYPGFELDQLVAPVIAVGRYLAATGDRGILEEPPLRALVSQVLEELAQWRGENGLYGTFLLPTDDPTDYPYVTTNNATVAVALRLLAEWAESPGEAGERLALAEGLQEALRAQCRREGRWAWALDAAGNPEWRDEPPLSLRTLAYWGLVQDGDGEFEATLRWLVSDYGHHYPGRYPGAGAPHFPAPSGFDLANRMLTGNQDLGDPVEQFAGAPLDTGIGCESWDPQTGLVRSGAAMASMAGFLAWTAWAAVTGHRHWSQALDRNAQPVAHPPRAQSPATPSEGEQL